MEERAGGEADGISVGHGIAWETGSAGRGIRAWWATCREVLFDPALTFRGLRPTGEMWNAFAFYLGTSVVVGIFAYKFSQLTQGLMAPVHALGLDLMERIYPPGVMDEIRRALANLEAQYEPSLLWATTQIFIFSVIYIFVAGLIVHVCLMLVGASGGGFESTFKAIAYTHGATAPLALIPLCGWVLSLLWMTVALVIALMEVHRVSTLRVIAGLSLPLIPLFCCVGLLMGLLILSAM
jgi:hypothetical protein